MATLAGSFCDAPSLFDSLFRRFFTEVFVVLLRIGASLVAYTVPMAGRRRVTRVRSRVSQMVIALSVLHRHYYTRNRADFRKAEIH